MKEITSTILGFMAAPLVAGIVFTIFVCINEYSEIHTGGYVFAMFLAGLGFSAVIAIVLGIPVFILLRRFKLVRWWSTLLFGLVVGAVIGVALAWPSLNHSPSQSWIKYALSNFAELGITGAISALSFWIVWQRSQINR